MCVFCRRQIEEYNVIYIYNDLIVSFGEFVRDERTQPNTANPAFSMELAGLGWVGFATHALYFGLNNRIYG